MLRKALRGLCWMVGGVGSVVTLLGLWGVIDPDPNQGYEVGLFPLKAGFAVTAVSMFLLLALRQRNKS
jgi:hypothetical protein